MAITIRVWIQFPVFGKLGLMFRPKKPSSHRITRTMMIIHINDMIFLLLNALLNDPFGCHLVGYPSGS
jgi:hypothetical protein